MSGWFDKQGNPMTTDQLRNVGEDYRRIGLDIVTGFRISTVWLGIDHSFGIGPPLLFETMVFPDDGSFIDVECERYSTEAEAIAGHAAMVAKYQEAQS